MQALATELKVRDRTLRQLKRSGRVALYELHGANGMLYGFEIVIIKVAPEQEEYPSNAWGASAWSYGRDYRDLAEECYKRLCRLEQHRVGAIDDLKVSEGQDSG